MLTLGDLRRVARARVDDAIALVKADRYDGAVYLCGYAVEIALKSRICRVLGWAAFPEEDREWAKHYKIIKNHELEVLVQWTACYTQLTSAPYAAHWNRVKLWDPETRYKLTGVISEQEAKQMVRSTWTLVSFLCPR